MKTTKEKILFESLKLFAQNGYEAVSVRDIAGRLGITQGALYRHFGSKREIFESILRRMEERDRENASEDRVPEKTFAETPEEYRKTSIRNLKQFTLSMFRYWTEDPFASAFRRMLTLEQYRTPEMSALYRQYFGGGVLEYVTDLFRANGIPCPTDAALRFYSPFYFLLNRSDSPEDGKNALRELKKHLKGFLP